MTTLPARPPRGHLGRALRRAVRSTQHRATDALDRLLRRHSDLPPAARSRFVGGGDFATIGAEFVQHLQQYAGLHPTDRVLDVGCGIGRVAIPLLDVLSAQGSYEGFDIVPHGIRWCEAHVTARNPRFRFRLADVRNEDYNPLGRQPAERYRFPYADESFDVALATSVFTHMRSAAVANYLREIARVLKPGGRCLATWFLLNDESRRLLAEGRSVLDFHHAFEQGLTTDPEVPEKAIAYPEAFVVDLYRRAGLELEFPIRYGLWCGRTAFVSGQDICIARKPLPRARDDRGARP